MQDQLYNFLIMVFLCDEKCDMKNVKKGKGKSEKVYMIYLAYDV